MVRTSVTFTGGGSKSRSKSNKARRASKRKKLGAKRSTITAAVKRALLNTTTSGLLGIELKYGDLHWTQPIVWNDPAVGGFPAAAYADPTAQHLVAVSQGTGPQQRVGNKITLKSVYCSGTVLFPGWNNVDIGGLFAGNIRSQHVHIALVLDKQTNGVRPSVGSIYTRGGVANNLMGPLRNMANTARFRVLKTWDLYRDMQGLLQPAGGASDAPDVMKKWEWSMNLKDLVINFLPTATTGNIADIMDNALHIVAWYDDNGWQTAPTITYSMRFRFLG